MNNISDWINNEVYPAIFERVDQIFPEHNFQRYRNGWRSQTYLNGSKHKDRPDKTVITSRAPYCILEQGGEVKNLYDYIKDRDALDDKQTLEILSQLSGEPLPKWDYIQSGNYQVKRTLDQILEDAQSYFVYCLMNSPGAKKVMDYLKIDRGYSEIDVKAMDLGFIPSQAKLLKHLEKIKNHKTQDINKALKLTRSIGENHILTIPFRESGGQIRGFIFRTIKEDIQPKYHYSTDLKKRDILFNLKAIKGDKDLIIMEGLLDALISEARGLNNVVALGGSSINIFQIKEAIKRGAKKITLCLDNDKPGEEATLRAMTLLNNHTDLPVFVATLPEGIKDPDQFIKQKGIEPLQEAIDKAVKSYVYKFYIIVNEYLKRCEEKGETTPKELEDFLEKVFVINDQIKNPVDRDLFLNHFLETLPGYKITKESLQATSDKLKYRKDREDQRREFDQLLKKATGLNQKGETNKALILISEQSKELLLKDKEVEYSRLLIPVKEDEIKNRQANKPDSIEAGYKIGEENLLLPSGALSIFAAPTSHGKSTILINILLNTAKQYQDKKFYLFSYEEDGDSILISALNTYTAKELSKNNRRSIRDYFKYDNDKHFSDDSKLIFSAAREQFFRELIDTGRINIHYLDYSSEALIEAIRYLHKNSNIGGVFIDYMQLLRKAEGKYFSRYEELKQICLDLKDLAVETGLPIILGAQFNREVTNHCHLHSTKIGEAGDIERMASIIIGMWNNNFTPLGTDGELNDIKREELNMPGTIYFKILKNRGGKIGIDGLLSFNGNAGKISNDPINDMF
ncbi:DNA primase [subsurface metagenome]